jgi:hypothetical protein
MGERKINHALMHVCLKTNYILPVTTKEKALLVPHHKYMGLTMMTDAAWIHPAVRNLGIDNSDSVRRWTGGYDGVGRA